jgi:TRAP-type transport system small permease protein
MPGRVLSYIADIQFERIFGAIALFAVFAIMLAGVVLRYGFSLSLTWYEEFGRYGLIFITALGIGAGIKNRSHIVIDISYLPTVIRRPARIAAYLVTLAFLAFLAWYALALAGALRASRSPAMQIPTSWFYFSFAILGVLGMVRLVEQAVRAYVTKGKGEH